MRRSVLLLSLLLLAGACTAPVHRGGKEETLIFLVRHAERAEDGTDDPHLAEEGRVRAALLAALLRDAGITHIYSTDLHRTRETAAPLADRAGLAVEIHDAGDPATFAARLRDTPGRHLVVGHSNTTPELVLALGGDPGSAMETMEYDRLYLVAVGPQGVNTVLLRFGAPLRE
jgi:phosphohistidine phosphatase SixA